MTTTDQSTLLRRKDRVSVNPEIRCVREMDPNKRIAAQFEMRETPSGTGAKALRFSGYASVSGVAYDISDAFGLYQETVTRTAFDKTLAKGADVAFLVNHGAGGGVTMARTKSGTMKLSSDATGLYVDATLNPTRHDVQIIRAAIQDGDLDEMSMAFRVTDQDWSIDGMQRTIRGIDLNQGDVSIVNYAANGATAGTVDLRSRHARAVTARTTKGTYAYDPETALRQYRLRHPESSDDRYYRELHLKVLAARSHS